MALRVFSTREGDEWRVWSVIPDGSAATTLDQEFRGGWLCFEPLAGGERRRLTLGDAPAGWESLPGERLDLLRRVATVVASAPLAPAAEVTGRRPIEERVRDLPSSPTSVVGDEKPGL
jgi:hypothetical protein